MLFLFSVFAIKLAFGAQLINCPRNQVKFEKIIGLRPSRDFPGYLLHKQENREAVTVECISKCLSKEDCVSFVLYYNVSECYLYNIREDGFQEEGNVIDLGVVWFEKTCLNAPGCEKLWIFERIPGAIFIGNDIKTLPGAMTRRECQQNCLEDTASPCKSAKFRILEDLNFTKTMGLCTLSDSDRHLLPNSYRVSTYNEEYFENQCANVTTNEFCAYEEYESVVFGHVDARYRNKSKEECEEICENATIFNCRGYSMAVINNTQVCLIHTEDSKVHGPKSLVEIPNGHYYEKARCLNITVDCSETYITIRYQPGIRFSGKIYMNGFSENLECYVLGKGTELIILKMPLFGNQCGISEAKSTNNSNRTLLSGRMILQYNPLIQTQGDRLIKVGCIFSNESKVVLGTGVNFTELTHPNQGTTIVNSSSVQPLVEMRVVDFYTQKEVSDTQIGQELQLIIEIQPADGPYDIWAGHLIAMTENGQDSILLLDDRGCPTNLNIFPSLTKVVNNDTKRLTGNFQAFKFTTSSIVRFSVIIQFCPVYCTPMDCGNINLSSGRRRREINSLINGTKVTEINKQQYDTQGKDTVQMPLELILVVRDPNVSPKHLIYGENKVLVAGYDFATNEVCIDYSLLIGIIITWVLTQLILIVLAVLMVRRYKKYYQQETTTQSLEELHKNFGLGLSNLETRRVHWADNGDYT